MEWAAIWTWLGQQWGWWKVVGYAGNAAFFSRFMIQWIASERVGKSIIPVQFWYMSIVGSVILAVYAFHTRDLVVIFAFAPNSLVYIRNLMLLHKERKAKQTHTA
ncbi:MAG: lipid-A-disaccharide synthase N-terminal domain-containing protein [Candidatus Brocadiia bacterium]